MGKSHSFFNSAIFYTLGVAFGLGAQFLLTTVLYGQWLDDVNFGLTQLYYTWFSVFGVIVGLEAANSLNNARIHYGEDKLGGYSSSLIGIGLVTLGVYAAALTIFQGFFVPAMSFSLPILLSASAQGFFWFCCVLIAQKCRVTRQPLRFVLWSVLAYLLRLALCVIIVPRMGADAYIGDIIGSVTGYSIAGAIAIVFLLRDGKTVFNKAYWKYCLVLTAPIVFHSLSNIVLGQADRVMLNSMSGAGEMGVYSFAYNIGAIANAVWIAFNNAWTVWYYDKTKEGKNGEILDLYKKYVWFISLLSFAIILIAPDLVSFFARDEALASGAPLTPVIMLGCFFMFLYSFPVAYETYRGKTVYIAVGTISAALCNIALNLVFIPVWGAMGAAITTLISYVALFFFHYIIARVIVRGFQIDLARLLLPAAFAACVMALAYAAMDVVWLRWALAAVSALFSLFVYKRSRHIKL